MVRVGGRSRGCRLCRQRRIKCDELLPACSQCSTTGRVCPGPVSGIIISDMNLAAARPTKPRRAPLVRPIGTSTRLEKTKKTSVIVDKVTPTPPSDKVATLNESVSEPGGLMKRVIGQQVPPEVNQFGLAFDPFGTLPVGTYFSVPKLIHHCTNSMADSLVNLGSGDPMRDAWNSILLSDALLLQCSLYTAAVHISAIYGINNNSNIDVVVHRSETLVLLNQRLTRPAEAINDVTLTAVLGFLAQVIVTRNVQETSLHLDGIEKMLAFDPSFKPADNVREILFWTDLVGSALCHTPPRKLTTRPQVRLLCQPLVMNPRSTIGVVCRGFQKILAKHGVFSSIADILHDLRCLTTLAHYSDCRAYSEMPLYVDLCRGVSQTLTRLPSMEGFRTFESCRLAVMAFTDIVLLNDNSSAPFLAAGIKSTLYNSSDEELMIEFPELSLWILFMGWIAAAGTKLETWFKLRFEKGLEWLKLQHLEGVRRVLIEFFWLEGISTKQLQGLWDAIKFRNPRVG
ncbi:hypothetical protein VTL71DRAFT_13239 [Oculimacula yallundae]|uniref:Zn(2)-C6 fungal-type domain-containing protein n=1 Tax=Oculimacula yallundae TaxID=86028 RepID=A0ABR4CJY4_9HELO